MSADHSTLARLHELAQVEAARLYGDAPIVPWRASRSGIVGPRVLRATALVFMALILATAGWATMGGWSTPVAGPVFVEANQEATVAPAVQPIQSSLDRAASHHTALPAHSLTVAPDGAGWRIDAIAASRTATIVEFARVTGTQLFGMDSLPGAPPLDLHWQGRDIAAAWVAIFGNEVGYALQCHGRHCRAWIFGTQGSPGAAGTPLVAGTRPPMDGLPLVTANVPDPHDRSAHD